MSDILFVVRYTGPFGFIKPWTAVRDSETYSQQFLTPSIVEGMRQKLEVSEIVRHRLSYAGMSRQMEEIQPRGIGRPEKRPVRKRGMLGEADAFVEGGVIWRLVMLEPVLHLVFPTEQDAVRAATQHLCLCRNEDVVLPDGPALTMQRDDFEQLDGFELRFVPAMERDEQAILVGYNRFATKEHERPMWGRLVVTGNAVREA